MTRLLLFGLVLFLGALPEARAQFFGGNEGPCGHIVLDCTTHRISFEGGPYDGHTARIDCGRATRSVTGHIGVTQLGGAGLSCTDTITMSNPPCDGCGMHQFPPHKCNPKGSGTIGQRMAGQRRPGLEISHGCIRLGPEEARIMPSCQGSPYSVRKYAAGRDGGARARRTTASMPAASKLPAKPAPLVVEESDHDELASGTKLKVTAFDSPSKTYRLELKDADAGEPLRTSPENLVAAIRALNAKSMKETPQKIVGQEFTTDKALALLFDQEIESRRGR